MRDLRVAQTTNVTLTENGQSPKRLPNLQKGGDPAAGSPTATLLRLSPNHGVRLRSLDPLRVSTGLLGAPHFRGLTGGVYKAQEHIHRGMLTRDY